MMARRAYATVPDVLHCDNGYNGDSCHIER